jgi:hypothetical protein
MERKSSSMSGKSDEARRDMPMAASLDSGSSEPWLIRHSNARRYFPGFRSWSCMLNMDVNYSLSGPANSIE